MLPPAIPRPYHNSLLFLLVERSSFCLISSFTFVSEKHEVSSNQLPAELSLDRQLGSTAASLDLSSADHRERYLISAAPCGAERCRALPCGSVLCRAVPCCAVLRAVLYLLFRACQESFEVLYQAPVLLHQVCTYCIVELHKVHSQFSS